MLTPAANGANKTKSFIAFPFASSALIRGWVFVFVLTIKINLEGYDKSTKCVYVHLYMLFIHTYRTYTHAQTNRENGKKKKNLGITLQKSSFKTVFNQLRQRLKMNGEGDRHTEGKDRREVVRDLGNSL